MVTITLNGAVYNFFRYGIDIPNSLIFQCIEGYTHPLYWFLALNPKLEFRLESQIQFPYRGNDDDCFHTLNRESIVIIYPECKCCGHKKGPDLLGWTNRISDTEYIFVFDDAKNPIEWLDKIYGKQINGLLKPNIKSNIKYNARELARRLLDYPDHNVIFKATFREGSPENPSNKLNIIECSEVCVVDVHPNAKNTVISGRRNKYV